MEQHPRGIGQATIYGTERRGRGGAVRMTRGPEVINFVKAVLYNLSAFGIAAFLVWAGSEYRRRTNEGVISDWATRMTTKLHDPNHNLVAGEKFYPEVEVVAADRTSYERSLMVQAGTRVKVRGFPGLALPAGGDSLKGTIAQGNRIPNVIVVDGAQSDSSVPGMGYGNFFCRDAEGVLWLGEPPGSGAVCAIDMNYLLARRKQSQPQAY